MTLTCATAGAAIYYTTDGSLPTPNSTTYTGSFAAPTGQLLRAMAYPGSESLPGLDSSNRTAQQF